MEEQTQEHIHGIMPKRPIQAEDFLRNNETYDGRGIVVAILDTGVDPGAAGLERTTKGETKIVAVRDCSGSGDVDMTKVVKTNSEDTTEGALEGDSNYITLQGLTGKYLKISKDTCVNPTGIWHVGAKAIYDFFPRGLVKRLGSHFGTLYSREHQKFLAAAIAELERFDEENSSQSLKREALLKRKELQARVNILEKSSNLDDSGLVVDCVVWQDQNNIWRALVDTKGNGDLRTAVPLASYEVEHTYSQWDPVSQLNYCVNIFNEGDLLSIVVDSGAHGTHVASIVAGYYPDQPELNGVAPGAQIVSLKIGDGRLDGMETGQSMIRAVSVAAELGVDIINMSFGEPSMYPSSGRVVSVMRELVEKHGIIFVTSAGNSGPALGTVGAPACAGDFMIGVAAYVEPAMMVSEYNLHRETTPAALNYTWSSRGPCYDGYLGVSISAPGAAIAAVPQWTLQQKMLMNGTSMASPNACGGIALILSGMKQTKLKFSPFRVKRAIEGTAELIPGMDHFAQGAGLIKVADAYEVLYKTADIWYLDLCFEVKTSTGSGIILREPWEVEDESKHLCTVLPRYESDDDDPAVGMNAVRFPKSKRNELEIQLKLETNASWLKIPEYVFQNNEISFSVNIMPSALVAGSGPHFAWIKANDMALATTFQMPLWKIPVTIIMPNQMPKANLRLTKLLQPPPYDNIISFAKVDFQPGTIKRYFLIAPSGSSWMDVKLSSRPEANTSNVVGSRIFYVHCLQMNQSSNYRFDENRNRGIRLADEPGQEGITSLDVRPGTVEVCVAQYWSSLGHGPIDIEVSFRGINPTPEKLVLTEDNGMVAKAVVTSPLMSTTINPSATLKTHCQIIAPKTSKILPMPNGTRDMVFGRPMWSLELDYPFQQEESGKVRATIPNLNEMIYESPVDLCMYYVYDENKSLLFTGEARPGYFSVPKGKLLLKLCIRHEDVALLKKLQSLKVVLERKLSKSIKLSFYTSLSKAIVRSKDGQASKKSLLRGGRTTYFVTIPEDFTLPVGSNAGDTLSGEITYCENKSWGSKTKPTPYPITVVISNTEKPPTQKEPKLQDESIDSSEDSKKDKVILKYILPVLKARVNGLDNFSESDAEAFMSELEETEALIKKYSNSKLNEIEEIRLSCLQSKLRWNQKLYKQNKLEKIKQNIGEICKEIATEANMKDLSAYLISKKKDFDDLGTSEATQKEESRMSELRKAIVYALIVRILVSGSNDEQVEDAVKQFANDGDLSFQQLRLERYRNSQYFGLFLTVLEKFLEEENKVLEELPIPLTKQDVYRMRSDAYEKLGWKHLVEAEEKRILKKFPCGYALF